MSAVESTGGRDRVLGVIKAYLRGNVTDMAVVTAVNNSSFRDKGLEEVLLEAAAYTPFTDEKQRRELLIGLIGQLRKRHLLT